MIPVQIALIVLSSLLLTFAVWRWPDDALLAALCGITLGFSIGVAV